MERKSSCCSGRSYATRVASPTTKNEVVTPKQKPVAKEETLVAPKEEKVHVKQDTGSSFTAPVAPSPVVPAATSVKKEEVHVKQDIGSSFTAPVAPSLVVPAATSVKKEEQMEVAAGFDDDCC